MAKGQLFDPYFGVHAARALEIKEGWPNQYTAAGLFQPVE